MNIHLYVRNHDNNNNNNNNNQTKKRKRKVYIMETYFLHVKNAHYTFFELSLEGGFFFTGGMFCARIIGKKKY